MIQTPAVVYDVNSGVVQSLILEPQHLVYAKGEVTVYHPKELWSVWNVSVFEEMCPGWSIINFDPQLTPASDSFNTVLVPDLSEWRVVEGSLEIPLVTQSRSLSECKDLLSEQLPNIRFIKETSGLSYLGKSFLTTRESQTLIHQAYTLAYYNNSQSFDFLTESGWQTLSSAQVQELYLLLSAKVQQCFSNHRALETLIANATSIAELQAIDLNSGW